MSGQSNTPPGGGGVSGAQRPPPPWEPQSLQEPNNFSQPDFGPERCTDDGHTNQHPVDGPKLRSELKPVLLGAINTPAAAAVLY